MISAGCRRRCAAILIGAMLSFAITARSIEARVEAITGEAESVKIHPAQGEFPSDGVPIEEFHCVPKSSGRFPVVMLLHGCAPQSFGAAEFRHMCISLAERGYYAMFIEYYGAAGAPNCSELAMTPTYSLAPQTPIPDDTWMRDLMAARDSLRNNPKADVTRLGLLGFSFGGTLAVITASLNPGTIAAIVDYYGFSNQRIEDAASGLSRFPPTLILQGDSDSRAHVTDSIHLHNVIAKHQKASEIRVYPGVEHGFNFPEDAGYDDEAARDAWARTLEFLDRRLKWHPESSESRRTP
jgi:dienelactone hydrolase